MIARGALLLSLLLPACRQPSPERAPEVEPSGARAEAPAEAARDDSPWSSRQGCLAALRRGEKLPRDGDTARVGSWNIRWFPDGKPGKRAAENGTDVEWLACAIAWLDVDALAVQELKGTAHARDKQQELLSSLDRHSKSKWALALDDCPNEASQHVGLLYDTKRVELKKSTVLPSLNPHGEACTDGLRPGLAAYVVFRGGLDLFLVSLHAKSGNERRSFELRQKSLDGIGPALRELGALDPDQDVVLAGDFNTMGCSKCSPAISAREELGSTDQRLAGLSPGFRRVGATSDCTELSGHGPSLLDHLVVSRSLKELEAEARARVSGPCAESSCRPAAARESDAVRRLSDHCPVVLDLRDRDEDP